MIAADLTVTHPWIAGPAAVAAALVAWHVIWKRGLVPLGRFIRNVNELTQDARELLAITPTLVDMAHEFRPNNGHTMRDSVNRIESKVDDAARKVDEATQSNARLEMLEARLLLLEGPGPAEPGIDG